MTKVYKQNIFLSFSVNNDTFAASQSAYQRENQTSANF